MLLDILRHGSALPALPGSSDESRFLSEEGTRNLKVVLERARDAGVKPQTIISSPYTRARQTASIAAEILGYEGVIQHDRALEPDGSPLTVWDDLLSRQNEGEILLVSHQPLVGELALLLLRRSVRIMPGTLLQIEIENPGLDPKGNLKMHFAPEERP